MFNLAGDQQIRHPRRPRGADATLARNTSHDWAAPCGYRTFDQKGALGPDFGVGALLWAYSLLQTIHGALLRMYAALLRIHAARRRMYAAHPRIYAARRRMYAALLRIHAALPRIYAAHRRICAALLRIYAAHRRFGTPPRRFDAAIRRAQSERQFLRLLRQTGGPGSLNLGS